MYLFVFSVMCGVLLKRKESYVMRISVWSSDVCSSDLVDDEFFGDVGIEFGVAVGGVVQGNDLHADYFGDIDAVPQNGWHQRAVVFQHRGLAGEEAVRFRPAKAEAHRQADRKSTRLNSSH